MHYFLHSGALSTLRESPASDLPKVQLKIIYIQRRWCHQKMTERQTVLKTAGEETEREREGGGGGERRERERENYNHVDLYSAQTAPSHFLVKFHVDECCRDKSMCLMLTK